jgi:hypothetical protein
MYALIKKLLREGLLLEITISDAWTKFYSDTTKFPALNGSIELFNKLNDLYPRNGDNFNKAYFNWLYSLLRNGKLKEEDFYKAKEYLSTFVKFYNKIPQEERDINQYKSLPELYNVVKDYIGSDEPTSKSDEKRQIKNEEIEKVFEDEDFLIMIPKTERASCLIGKGTQWCTAAVVSNNRFNSYNDQGPLYVIIDKDNNKKYQLHFETNQLMDAEDRSIGGCYFFEEIVNDSVFDFLQTRYERFWDFILETSVEDIVDGGYCEMFTDALSSEVTPSVLSDVLSKLRGSNDSSAIYTGFVYEKDPNEIDNDDLVNLFDNKYIDPEDLEGIMSHLEAIKYDFENYEVSDNPVSNYREAMLGLSKNKLEIGINYQTDKGRELIINKINIFNPEKPYNITVNKETGNVDIETLVNYIHQGQLFESKSIIKKLLRESLINEIRVINPNYNYNKGKFTSMEDESPLHDNETIRVYHGFNKYEDAIMAAKFGLSGQEKARRIYSYESNNNPNGLFVTLDYETAKKFTYPSGSRGIKVVMELSVKVGDLEAPVWPGGSYTVQGQMSQYWKDAEDRKINGTLKARDKASNSAIPFVRDSDRPEVAAALMGNERQALFVGNINPNMIKSVFFGESGKHGYTPKTMERISRQEFLNKFESHEPERNSDNSLSNRGEQYHKKKDMLFKPNDDFNMEIFNKECIDNEWDSTGIEMLKKLKEYRYLENWFWPKQIKQINDLLENYEQEIS